MTNCSFGLRLCVDWCCDDLIYSDQAVDSIDEAYKKSEHFLQFGGDIFVYEALTGNVVENIQHTSTNPIR